MLFLCNGITPPPKEITSKGIHLQGRRLFKTVISLQVNLLNFTDQKKSLSLLSLKIASFP